MKYSGINLEETLSTLDYAHRAKNIQNKPEVDITYFLILVFNTIFLLQNDICEFTTPAQNILLSQNWI